MAELMMMLTYVQNVLSQKWNEIWCSIASTLPGDYTYEIYFMVIPLIVCITLFYLISKGLYRLFGIDESSRRYRRYY